MDVVKQHQAYAPETLGFAVLSVSSSRGLEEDEAGRAIERMVGEAGHRNVDRLMAPDSVAGIRGPLRTLLRRDEVDVVVVTGGTGVSPRDLTPEAVMPLLEKDLPGFGELLRMLSFEQIGAAAMLGRGFAGVTKGKAVFVLPGSPAAVELAMERLILPEAPHLIGQLRRRR
ncbi:MAG TPA: MogA/MoaB family molybdenum cofactor biosynthesis protein [Thermoanaerobaculia bacterium]|nr:MogA/MoaB family molybdenum cofactor biosynthesis protein [Thermoanaerobaculia bacterium]